MIRHRMFRGDQSDHCCVEASCQSFLLIRHGYSETNDLTLINPLTRRYTNVSGCRHYAHPSYCHMEYYGLGYDEKNNDYKILKVMDYPFSDDGRRKLYLYSFNSDSWRRIKGVIVGGYLFECRGDSAATINNHLMHCLFRSCDGQSASNINLRICCFDVCSEQWIDDVPLPESVINSNALSNLDDIYAHLVVFEEYLCFLVKNKDDKTFDMWIMKEYGVQSSWLKLAAIPFSCIPNRDGKTSDHGMFYPRVHPIAYRSGSRNEILFSCENYDKGGYGYTIICYNIRDEVFSRATEFDKATHISSGEIYMCKGSLVTTFGASQIRAKKRKHTDAFVVDEDE